VLSRSKYKPVQCGNDSDEKILVKKGNNVEDVLDHYMLMNGDSEDKNMKPPARKKARTMPCTCSASELC
jgi:hypothetical protein